ncbi:MAG: choice-of-anchor V domain-containing protein [Saprospiraceae bacterium]
MKTYYFLGFLMVVGLVFVSSQNGVPQPVAGAPGDASASCKFCHSSAGNYTTSVMLTLLNKDSLEVNQYIPGESYKVKLNVSGTNSPKSYGFQMVGLTSGTNLDVGTWSNLGSKVRTQTITVSGKKRNYLVQSAPNTVGLFEAVWKAPDTDQGDIVFYFAGLSVNLNGRDSGDNHANGTKTFMSSLSDSEDDISENKINLWPNPVVEELNISEKLPSIYTVFNDCGQNLMSGHLLNQKINVSHLNRGNYYLILTNANGIKSYPFMKI